MAVFTREEEAQHNLDYGLMQAGSVTAYRNQSLMADDLARLEDRGYEIMALDCTDMQNADEFCAALIAAMQLPPSPAYSYIGFPVITITLFLAEKECRGTGKVLAFSGCEKVLLAKERKFFLDFLDRLDRCARESMLMGERLIILLQADIPISGIACLGGNFVKWNRHEDWRRVG